MKITPFDSPALSFQGKSYPYSAVPYRVRAVKAVHPDIPFFIPEKDRPFVKCEQGQEYPALVNSYGAVSAILQLPDGGNTCLGLRPDEFTITQWHWGPIKQESPQDGEK
jgi:hypothetical protein